MLVGAVGNAEEDDHVRLERLRAAIRSRHKVRFRYRDEKGAPTRRTFRPLTLWLYPATWLAVRCVSCARISGAFTRPNERGRRVFAETFPTDDGKSAEDLFRRLLGKT
jgi:predicted DNA-binding transcriptional regulator YafY